MNTGQGLLAAILDQPADDTARLVYADYLDGDAEPREPERAEFIRLQIELARLPESTWAVIPDDVYEKVHRAEQLLSDGGWFPETLGGAPVFKARPLGQGNCGVEYEADDGDNPHVIFRRGFAFALSLPSPRGLADLLRSWPIEAVTVGTLSFRVLSPACPRQSFPGTWSLDEVGRPLSARCFLSRAGLVAGVEWVEGRLDNRRAAQVAVPLDGWTIEIEEAPNVEDYPPVILGRLTRRGTGGDHPPPQRGTRFGPVSAVDRGGRVWTCFAVIQEVRAEMPSAAGPTRWVYEAASWSGLDLPPA